MVRLSNYGYKTLTHYVRPRYLQEIWNNGIDWGPVIKTDLRTAWITKRVLKLQKVWIAPTSQIVACMTATLISRFSPKPTRKWTTTTAALFSFWLSIFCFSSRQWEIEKVSFAFCSKCCVINFSINLGNDDEKGSQHWSS